MNSEMIGEILILVGVFLTLTSAVGVLRMPDFYTRMHAASVADGLAVLCVVVGIMLLHGATLYSVKLLILFVFFRITSPTASHALVKSAMHVRLPVWKQKEVPHDR